MKTAIESALTVYREYLKAEKKWEKALICLHKELSAYIDHKNEKFCIANGLKKTDIIRVSLDGGSRSDQWNINECVYFYDITILNRPDPSLICTFKLTDRGTWLHELYEESEDFTYKITVTELSNGPFLFSAFFRLLEEIYQDTGITAEIHKHPIGLDQSDPTNSDLCASVDKVVFLDGTVYTRPVRDEEE